MQAATLASIVTWRVAATAERCAMGTTSGLYVSHRGHFHYVASWEILGARLKWTAVVRDGCDASARLLMGEIRLDRPEADLNSVVRHQIEDRIDRAAWLK
jgi:hypothetical protein